jgi:hypothetical protein
VAYVSALLVGALVLAITLRRIGVPATP